MFEQFVFRVVVAETEIKRVHDHACRMREQMSDCDPTPAFRRIVEIFADAVIEFDFALFDKDHYGRRSKLLTDRAGLKYCFRFDRDLMFDVGEAVPFGKNDLTGFYDSKRKSWDVLLLQLGFDVLIDFG